MNIKTKVVPLLATITTIGSLSGGAIAQNINWADFEARLPIEGYTDPSYNPALSYTGIQLGSGSFDVTTTGLRNKVGDPVTWGSYEPTTLGGLVNNNHFQRMIQANSTSSSITADMSPTKVTFSNFSGLDYNDLVFAIGGLDSNSTFKAFNGLTQVNLTFLGDETPQNPTNTLNTTHTLSSIYNTSTGAIDIQNWATATRPAQSKMAFFTVDGAFTSIELDNLATEPGNPTQAAIRDSYILAVGEFTSVPEPSATLLVGLSGFSFLMRRRR